jgi:hypothetical protein
MNLYGEDNHEEKGLDEAELQHLGKQLVEFVTNYRRLIRITTPDVENKLNTLYEIGMCIMRKQYDQLFNDPSVVINRHDGLTFQQYQLKLYESGYFQ